jgi:DNA-binding NtrC family response regulator
MDGQDDQRTARTVATPRPRSRRRPGRIKLRVLSGPQAGVEYATDRKRIRIGRSRTADLTIDDESVSGLHLDLRLTPRGVEVIDLESTNGTTLFGRQIGRACILPGDSIVAGTCGIQLLGVDDIDVDELDELRHDAKLSDTRLSVLVTGETGTGKELVSLALHRRSSRRHAPFVVLDCSALSSPLAESILHGHVKGVFADALAHRAGVFEQANGGTLLLDRVGEIPLALQVRLLEVLSRGQVTRIGAHRSRPVDVRVVAATHQDLRAMVQRGTFREDLYFRLAQVVLDVPPLRERGDDIERIARVFLDRIVARNGRPRTFAPEALALLRRHPWPGNVRELSNAIDRAAALCDDGVIQPDDFGLDRVGPAHKGVQLEDLVRSRSYAAIHEAVDRFVLPRALEQAGSLRKAAAMLGIGRKRLTTLLQNLRLY